MNRLAFLQPLKLLEKIRFKRLIALFEKLRDGLDEKYTSIIPHIAQHTPIYA